MTVNVICKVCEIKFEAENFRTKMCSVCSRQKQLDRCKSYKQRNKESVSEYNKAYKEEHKEEVDEYNRVYNIGHREEIQERQTRTQRERRKIDPEFKMSHNLRASFNDYVKKQLDKIYGIGKLVNCSSNQLRLWLEHNFTQDMTWENYGTYWHVDHIFLCSIFNLLVYEEQKTCFCWENTRPLQALKNLKRKKLTKKDILHQEIRIYYFKKHKDDFKNHQNYFDTKLIKKLISGLG